MRGRFLCDVSLERSYVRARSGQETFTTLCVRNIVSCQEFFPLRLCVLEAVSLNGGSVCAPLSVYYKAKNVARPPLSSTCFPSAGQGWEKNTLAVFSLQLTLLCAFVRVHLYLFIYSPLLCLSLFFHAVDGKKERRRRRTRLCRPCPVQAGPVQWWSNKKENFK